MTGPTSAPRGEHAPTPGVTWNTQLITTGEVVVDTDDGDSPFGWRELDPPPTTNRATRRAIARAARRNR